MLQVHIADHPLDLLPLLVDGLSEPLADPFASDWVVVPSLGVRAWLSGQLSERLGATGPDRHDGVAANIRFPFPGSLRWTILGAASGSPDDVDPWQEERLVWSLLEVLRNPPAALDRRLLSGEHGVSAAARAQAVATLFDTYNVHRPGMVQAWVAGDDVDATGSPIGAQDQWQPALFRLVHDVIRSRFGVEELPSIRLERAVEAVRSGDAAIREALGERLPERLFLFGQSIWSSETGPLLDALAVDRRVLALVPSPSSTVSARLARTSKRWSGASSLSWSGPRGPLAEVEHPLLASWGLRPLETAVLLGAGGVDLTVVEPPELDDRPSLLHRVQADLRSGTPGASGSAGPDRSLQVHGAPGRTRQVEVLRDVILDLLDRGVDGAPPLTEADVAVVCHRLDEFAPLIGAVWGPSSDDPHAAGSAGTPRLRYSLVDRAAGAVNPVVEALQALLDLVPGRMDRGAVVDLLSLRAVRERFGLGTEDLELLDDWVERSGVRWGIDGEHREQDWELPASYEDHTWATGIAQLAAGVAAGEPLRLAQPPGVDAAPAGEFDLSLGGAAITTVADGRLDGATRLVDALCSLVEVRSQLLDQPSRTVDEWVRVVSGAVDAIAAPERFADWQRLQLDDALTQLVERSGPEGSPSATDLQLSDLRRLLGSVLDRPPARGRLGVGGISIARPSQLAGVPYRVVCVLGLDGDALPVGGRSGDDIGARSPLVGDRDVRHEARAELLSVLTTATDAVVVTFNSQNVRTNAAVPRSAVLDELLDTIGAVAGVAPDDVVVAHPRQAFDPINFSADPEVLRPPGFDAQAARAANVLIRQATASSDEAEPSGPQALVPEALAVEFPAAVELEDLRRFHRSPVERFLRDVLAVTVPRSASGDSERGDVIPIGMSPLDQAEFGRRLLDVARAAGSAAVLRSADPGAPSPAVAQVAESFRARGALPPPALATAPLAEVAAGAAAVFEAAVGAGYHSGELHEVQIDVELGTRWLSGVVPSCTLPDGDDEPGPVVIRYTRPKGYLRLAACVDLLALTVQQPEVPWRALLVTRPDSAAEKRTRAPSVAEVSTYRVRGESPAERGAAAASALDVILEQYERGRRSPLPLFPETSSAFRLRNVAAAAKAWGDPRSSWTNGAAESRRPDHQLAFGVVDFGELLDLRAAGTTFRAEAEATWGTLVEAIDGLVGEDGGGNRT